MDYRLNGYWRVSAMGSTVFHTTLSQRGSFVLTCRLVGEGGLPDAVV
jgi:hypothetical protein